MFSFYSSELHVHLMVVNEIYISTYAIKIVVKHGMALVLKQKQIPFVIDFLI